MDRIPRPGEIYRHFKGKLYQIITVAEHTETGEQLVIYQALYGTFRTYARPLAMFTGEVDREKYPEAAGKYRFEKVEQENLPCQRPETSDCFKKREKTEQPEEQLQSTLSPLLLPFVEAEDFDVKLEILSAMDNKISQEELDILHEALDLPKGTGSSQEQLRSLKQYLEMQKKYDGARLR